MLGLDVLLVTVFVRLEWRRQRVVLRWLLCIWEGIVWIVRSVRWVVERRHEHAVVDAWCRAWDDRAVDVVFLPPFRSLIIVAGGDRRLLGRLCLCLITSLVAHHPSRFLAQPESDTLIGERPREVRRLVETFEVLGQYDLELVA